MSRPIHSNSKWLCSVTTFDLNDLIFVHAFFLLISSVAQNNEIFLPWATDICTALGNVILFPAALKMTFVYHYHLHKTMTSIEMLVGKSRLKSRDAQKSTYNA